MISRFSWSSFSCFSASPCILLMSLSESPELASILIDCSLFEALSFAVTFKIPLASTSKLTSICGIPRGAGGMLSKMKRPRDLLSAAIARSPCVIWISTCVWLSAAVENVWLRCVGIVVFLSMSFVETPPMVSIPSESGITSRRSTSFTSP